MTTPTSGTPGATPAQTVFFTHAKIIKQAKRKVVDPDDLHQNEECREDLLCLQYQRSMEFLSECFSMTQTNIIYRIFMLNTKAM